MPTLFHARHSRSSMLVALIDELGAAIEIREVSIPRFDGTGGPDPANPHPEKKVPFLVDGDQAIRERGAIILHLTGAIQRLALAPCTARPVAAPICRGSSTIRESSNPFF